VIALQEASGNVVSLVAAVLGLHCDTAQAVLSRFSPCSSLVFCLFSLASSADLDFPSTFFLIFL
jgi:hypothetical protein